MANALRAAGNDEERRNTPTYLTQLSAIYGLSTATTLALGGVSRLPRDTRAASVSRKLVDS